MSASRVVIVDAGGANISSLKYALERLGSSGQLSLDAGEISDASHVILPGVGAAQAAMDRLEQRHLIDVIQKLDQPVLGICLGMQLLAVGSEEGNTDCIGVFPDRAAKLPASPEVPVPNMGWCQLTQTGRSRLLCGIDDGSWFYFVHSYAVPIGGRTIASAVHTQPFSALLEQDNFFAAQFHPERSSAAGARLLKNFLDMT